MDVGDCPRPWQTRAVSGESAPHDLFREVPPGEEAVDERPKSKLGRFVRGLLALATTGFVAYHTLVLMVWNTPGKGLAKTFHSKVLDVTKGSAYFQSTSNSQSWAMFAPNPNRTNVFIRVLVTDEAGETFDIKHDIWEVDRWPYFFYDRMGKINRRIDGKKSYQRIYGAWVCRQWEREHGELPDHVQFVKRFTRVPAPRDALRMGWGWDPWELPSKQVEQEKIDCKRTVHAQLPPRLRERFGMEPAPDDHFRDVRIPTWHTRIEQEQLRAEREAEREQRRRGLGADDQDADEADEPGDPFATQDM